MSSFPGFNKYLRKAFALASVFSVSFLFVQQSGSVLAAPSISDLQAQQKALQEQAAAAAQQAQQQKTLAQRAAESIQKVAGQISVLSDSLQTTQQQIGDVQSQISQKNQDVDSLESNLRTITDQQNALIRHMYILTESQPDSLALFSSQSVSSRAQTQEQFSTLQKAAAALYAKTKEQENQVVAARDQLKQKNDSLASLQSQQQTQQQVLADQKMSQQAFKDNALSAEQQLEAKSAAAKAAAANIATQIQRLSQTAKWGTQIVSDAPASWYYTQTGDYTTLGNSFYTISEVGCLITSIAMVATYYGHHITPDYIANNGAFSDGYLVALPRGLGITTQASRPVNWSTVNNELANNRPVIVSIKLAGFPAINADGSTHYVVLSGGGNGKYTMQDPIAPGRGYNTDQVRSMILVTNN